MTKYAIITTTINVPHNLEAYVKDTVDQGLRNDVFFVVAGDRKTPMDAAALCDSLAAVYNIQVDYLTPTFQEITWPVYSKFLGWNTIQRRNIAMLYAYNQGADVVVTIDDDNYLTAPNYLAQHGLLAESTITETTSSSSGWYNICRRLQHTGEFYPRGYSIKERGTHPRIKSELLSQRAVVNAGLWIGDPDVDAVTRLAINPKVENALTPPFTLAPETYAPFNSQNTAIHRDVLPAYCMVSGVGRYDDIIPSFFVKRIADHLGDAIRFGTPLVRQERNPHNLFKDLENEVIGMQLTDRLVDWLRTVELKGVTYGECIKEITEAVRKRWINDGSLTLEQIGFMRGIVLSYEAWGETL